MLGSTIPGPEVVAQSSTVKLIKRLTCLARCMSVTLIAATAMACTARQTRVVVVESPRSWSPPPPPAPPPRRVHPVIASRQRGALHERAPAQRVEQNVYVHVDGCDGPECSAMVEQQPVEHRAAKRRAVQPRAVQPRTRQTSPAPRRQAAVARREPNRTRQSEQGRAEPARRNTNEAARKQHRAKPRGARPWASAGRRLAKIPRRGKLHGRRTPGAQKWAKACRGDKRCRPKRRRE